ncbi:hypothetical protein GGF46_000992 [Coemansia sp. RSA 552]|nr:hypothetical protein GGF46_000992 [Coemansia sp. RSA 552]
MSNPKHTSQRGSASGWSCLPCGPPNSVFASFETIYNGDDFPCGAYDGMTDSRAMEYAMTLAAEYVRVAEQYPVLSVSGNPDIQNADGYGSAPVSSRTSIASTVTSAESCLSLDGYRPRYPLLQPSVLAMDKMEEILALPIKSTRSSKTRPQSASSDASNGATLCDSSGPSIEKKPRISGGFHDSSNIKSSLRRQGRRFRSIFT